MNIDLSLIEYADTAKSILYQFMYTEVRFLCHKIALYYIGRQSM